MTSPHLITSCDHYRHHSAITDPREHRDLLAGLPSDIPGLCRVVHGTVIHKGMGDIYGCEIPEARKAEADVREIAPILARLRELDPRPLVEPRPPQDRYVGHCRVASLLMTSLLREKGYAARTRAGFSMYFESFYGDHWLVEVWDEADRRWVLVDPEYDDILIRDTGIRFSPYDVPRDKFLVAGSAWRRCRSGELDPAKIGLSPDDAGMAYARTQLLRDLASLCKVEVTAIEAWGIGAIDEAEITPDDLTLLDHVAALTEVGTVEAISEACHLFHTDPRLTFGHGVGR